MPNWTKLSRTGANKMLPTKKVWKNVKKHFASGIRDVLSNPANKKRNGYAHKVGEERLDQMDDNKKFFAQQMLESKQVAIQLCEELDQIKNNSNTSNDSDKNTKELTEQEKFIKFIKSMTFAKGGASRPQKNKNDMPNNE